MCCCECSVRRMAFACVSSSARVASRNLFDASCLHRRLPKQQAHRKRALIHVGSHFLIMTIRGGPFALCLSSHSKGCSLLAKVAVEQRRDGEGFAKLAAVASRPVQRRSSQDPRDTRNAGSRLSHFASEYRRRVRRHELPKNRSRTIMNIHGYSAELRRLLRRRRRRRAGSGKFD